MKKFLISIAAAAVTLTAMPSAAVAAPWQSINQRQSNLYNRIEQGVRNGALNRNEAGNLRSRFANINRLEQQYRRSNGLSLRERNDLDQRFAALNRSVRVQKNDRQVRR